MSHKLIALVIVSLLCGCGGTSKRTSARAENPTPQDEALEIARSTQSPDAREYEAIDKEYRKHNHDEVMKRSQRFLKNYPNSILLEQVYHLRALTNIAQKQYPQALTQLKRTIELSKSRSEPSRNLIGMASYNLAFVNFEIGQHEQAAKYLDELNPNDLDSANKSKFFILRAKVARTSLDYESSVKWILSALQLNAGKSGNLNKAMLGFLDESVERVENAAFLEKVASEYDEVTGADRVYLRLASLAMRSGDRVKASRWSEKILKEFPDSPHRNAASEMMVTQEQGSSVQAGRIGVLLTLSGKYAKIGNKALQGMQMGLQVFGKPAEPSEITLVVQDDKGEPESAVKALEELYFKHGVVAVIGPISSKLVDPVAKKAKELGLPVITLAQKEAARDPMEDLSSTYVFSGGLTPYMQAYQLVKYAREKMNLQRFAMIAPASQFGTEYTRAFWDQLDLKNGTVLGYETYPEDETDFRNYIDKMVGLNATDARAKEVQELNELKMLANPGKKKSKKIDRLFDLKPVVDFEAVFVPDEPRVLGQLLPTFAYRDVDNVQFFGSNAWNSQDLVSRAGRFAENAVFVDGFFAKSGKPSVQKFIEEYRKVFSGAPSIIELNSYEVMRLVQQIMKQNSSLSRDRFREKFASITDATGVCGPISVRNGNVIKTLHMLTLKGGKIQEIAF